MATRHVGAPEVGSWGRENQCGPAQRRSSLRAARPFYASFGRLNSQPDGDAVSERGPVLETPFCASHKLCRRSWRGYLQSFRRGIYRRKQSGAPLSVLDPDRTTTARLCCMVCVLSERPSLQQHVRGNYAPNDAIRPDTRWRTPMTASDGISRRKFLETMGMGAAVIGGAGVLAACGSSASTTTTTVSSSRPKRGGTLRAGLSGGSSADTLNAPPRPRIWTSPERSISLNNSQSLDPRGRWRTCWRKKSHPMATQPTGLFVCVLASPGTTARI